MQFNVAIGGLCPGGNHITITVTAGAQSKSLIVTKEDFTLDYSDIGAVLDNLLVLMRSRVKEDGATTNAQIKTSIERKAFFL